MKRLILSLTGLSFAALLSGCYVAPAPAPVAYYRPAPVYVAPRPVYVAPPPVYIAPRPVYVVPAPRPYYRPPPRRYPPPGVTVGVHIN